MLAQLSSASLLRQLHPLTGTTLSQPICWADSQDLPALQVAIKLEHKTSKGCTSGSPPHEWSVYA